MTRSRSHGRIEDLTPGRVEDAHDAARARHLAAARKHRVGGRQIERRDQTRAERERGDVGQVVEAGLRGKTQHGVRPDALLKAGGGRVVRLEERLAQRERVGFEKSSAEWLTLRGCHSGSPGADTALSFVSTDTGENPCSSAAA